MTEREVDIVVLGCGAAGVAVALEATRRGASVLILEKQTPERHTPNVRMSGGWVMTFTEVDGGVDYLRASAGGLVEERHFRPWAERALHTTQWLADMGVELRLADTEKWGLSRPHGDQAATWAEHPWLPGAGVVRAAQAFTDLPAPFEGEGPQFRATGEVYAGEALYRGLMHTLSNEGIEVVWDTETLELIRDSDDAQRVRGVRTVSDGAELTVLARKGVVLAAGGFGGNPDMVRQFLTVPNTKFYGNPGNDGSGIKLAMSAGSDLVHMNRMVGRGIAAFDLEDGREMGFMIILHGGGYVLCDQTGNRFADEFDLAQQSHTFSYNMEHFDLHEVAYTRSPSYYIFDARRLKAGSMTYHDRGAAAFGIYDWSPDNQVEVDKGWISQGATPGQAARKAGASEEAAAAVDAEVASYNAGIAAGEADRLGRPDDTMIALDEPPYYCIPMFCGGPYTSGGPRRDELGRVLDTLGAPIPGLFSAGEMGQAVGLLYPTSGASISEAFCLGGLTGEYLAETPNP